MNRFVKLPAGPHAPERYLCLDHVSLVDLLDDDAGQAIVRVHFADGEFADLREPQLAVLLTALEQRAAAWPPTERTRGTYSDPNVSPVKEYDRCTLRLLPQLPPAVRP